MKRVFAAIVLLSALGMLVKLAGKGERLSEQVKEDSALALNSSEQAAALAEDAIRARYPEHRELVDRVLERYRLTALEIEASDGLRGLRLLDKLDLEAIYLYEKHPSEFRQLAGTLNEDAAADLLVHWASYFGLKRADDIDRAILIREIARLAPSQRRLAGKYPHALPLILAEPSGVCDLIRRLEGDPKALNEALIVLDFLSLENGPADLRRALRTLELHRLLALDAFRQFGPEGFALVTLYGPVLQALGHEPSLDQALILLRVNTDDVDAMLRDRSPESLAASIRHVAASGLVEAVGNSPHGLRLSVEYGKVGDLALQMAGGDAADVVYEEYDDPTLRNQAVRALGLYGPMAAAILSKYATDSDFQAILQRDGPAVIPPIAQSDLAPEALLALEGKPRRTWSEALAKQVLAISGESGQATIRLIRSDGLARAESLSDGDLRFYQFLPLYDLVHLGGVLGRGHSPTKGEMAWALIDGCFVVLDVVSLTALQPGGAAASELARSEVKATARAALRTTGRDLVEEVAPRAGRQGVELATQSSGRLARWWAVRNAGGTYQALRRVPEALEHLNLSRLTTMAQPFCGKAGLRLTRWSPIRFSKHGAPVILGIPTDRWGKYVGVNAAQAGLGVVAMHKMEEYLSSQRPESAP